MTEAARLSTADRAQIFYNKVGWFFVASMSMALLCFVVGSFLTLSSANLSFAILLFDLGSIMLIPSAIGLVLCVFIVVFFMMRFSLRGLLCSTISLGAAIAMLQAENQYWRLFGCALFVPVAAYWMILWIEAFSPNKADEAAAKQFAPTNSPPDNPSKTSPTSVGPN
jgi:hypothetical protein